MNTKYYKGVTEEQYLDIVQSGFNLLNSSWVPITSDMITLWANKHVAKYSSDPQAFIKRAYIDAITEAAVSKSQSERVYVLCFDIKKDNKNITLSRGNNYENVHQFEVVVKRNEINKLIKNKDFTVYTFDDSYAPDSEMLYLLYNKTHYLTQEILSNSCSKHAKSILSKLFLHTKDKQAMHAELYDIKCDIIEYKPDDVPMKQRKGWDLLRDVLTSNENTHKGE